MDKNLAESQSNSVGLRTGLITTVETVRKRFEQKRISQKRLRQLYSEYNHEVDGNIFVIEAQKIFPKLNCGLATVYLKNLFGGEIIRGTYDGNKHTFLLLNQKTIVDITADQYGGPRVYVGEIKYPWAIK